MQLLQRVRTRAQPPPRKHVHNGSQRADLHALHLLAVAWIGSVSQSGSKSGGQSGSQSGSQGKGGGEYHARHSLDEVAVLRVRLPLLQVHQLALEALKLGGADARGLAADVLAHKVPTLLLLWVASQSGLRGEPQSGPKSGQRGSCRYLDAALLVAVREVLLHPSIIQSYNHTIIQS